MTAQAEDSTSTRLQPQLQLQLVMNEVCYEKVLDQAGKNQTLVFVHSRKETSKTAKFLRDMAVEKELIMQFVKPDGATREILTEEAGNVKDANLRGLLPFGFAIHHAGMSREDRGLVEELFADGSIQVLVCSATLAWGVNLPAHTGIIKAPKSITPKRVVGSNSHRRTCCRCLVAQADHNTTLSAKGSSLPTTPNFSIISVYSTSSYQSNPS